MTSPAWMVLVDVPLCASMNALRGSPDELWPTDTIRGGAGVGVGPVAGVGVGVGPVIVLSQAIAMMQKKR